MIKIENIEVFGWEAAIRGMRNPKNSWDKRDSYYGCIEIGSCETCSGGAPCEKHGSTHFSVGPNDLDLMQRLCKAGSDHRKFMRMINISMDITAPLYWWKEFDTYRMGVSRPDLVEMNSCSTMHKIADKEFELSDFSHEHLIGSPTYTKGPLDNIDYGKMLVYENNDISVYSIELLELTVEMLNGCRELYLETNDKRYWWQMIQLLPSSYNQKRTIQMNYEAFLNMDISRSGHKLDEWKEFVRIKYKLPYYPDITGRF